jgi:UPF0758 N-terminal
MGREVGKKKDRGDRCRPQLHTGHRGRLRERFLREGLDGFEDHQLLELLLFQAIPRHDTNPVAHSLMRRFGSLSAVLEADPKDLASVEGVGPNALPFFRWFPRSPGDIFTTGLGIHGSRSTLRKPLQSISFPLWQAVLRGCSI